MLQRFCITGHEKALEPRLDLPPDLVLCDWRTPEGLVGKPRVVAASSVFPPSAGAQLPPQIVWGV